MDAMLAIGLLAQCLALVLSSTNTTTTTSESADDSSSIRESADSLFDEYWEWFLHEFPETATMIGDSRYDDRLHCVSLQCDERRQVMYEEYLERADQLLPKAIEGSLAENNLQLFIFYMHFQIDTLTSKKPLFPLSNRRVPQNTLLYLVKYMKLDTAEQYHNLLSRYMAFPQQIDEIIQVLEEGMRRNYTLHNVSMISNLDQWNQTATESPFYKPFTIIPEDLMPAEERKILQKNATEILTNILIPSFLKLEDFLDNEYALHTRPEIGAGSLPGGREFYHQQLRLHLTDPSADPQEVHRLGTQEVARIAIEMQQVIHSLGLNMSRGEFSDELRKNRSQYFNSEEEAIETYRYTLKTVIPPKLTKLFKKIPSKELAIEKLPKELITGTQAFYNNPGADDSTPGTFYLDTSNLGNIPKYDVMTLSLHEGIPGHHFQRAYLMEEEGIPAFRKFDLRSNAYLEGWALYSEYLGYELGLYEDPFMRYGHLSQEIFRSCRMVVDTGMHVMGWSLQQAADYMMEYSALPLAHIKREVERYITFPGHVSSYKYGELKIKGFRKKAEDQLGEKFDIKEFHDIIVLSYGPFEYAERQIDRYIQSQLAK